MKLSDFDFDLPESAVARHPATRRDESRLLVLDRRAGTFSDTTFATLDAHLTPADLLVVNDTKVMRARLDARKAATGGKVELLLVEPLDEEERRWRVMVGSSKPVRAGAELSVGDDRRVQVEEVEGDGFAIVRLPVPGRALAAEIGRLPLPPYIDREVEPEDLERYQTVYARDDADRSVAAPTAGLHFTPALLERLERQGIRTARVTLHVGPGTFLPVRTDDVSEHRMHAEAFEVTALAAERIEAAGRVVAVGTTATRVLESVGRPVMAARGRTELFIRPGFDFAVVGAMITNFHLPRSTLLMLVSAFAGRELILEAYRHAVREGYRFFSYGDAMLIV